MLGQDNYLTVNLEHNFDILEILSLKLGQTQLYRRYNADYGVVVGRVVVNQGVGVPNAKVSVFIPLDKEDETNQIISTLYPYKSPNQKNASGIRYNLLPNEPQNDCHRPVGTMPTKAQLLDNDSWVEIFDKYYKFTTTTNSSGDYMLIGVPLGAQILHMDVDFSDAGFLSLKPYDFIVQGYNANQFNSPAEFRTSSDLNTLPQIFSQDKSTNIKPFWGNRQTNEIGINRVDFDLQLQIVPTALFTGSIFSDSKKARVNRACRPRRKVGKNCELQTGFGTIEAVRVNQFDDTIVEPLQLGQYSQIDENGNWIVPVVMNRTRLVTDELGNLIPSEDPTKGIPTTANVRFRISLNERLLDTKVRTAYYLVPNMYNRFDFFSNVNLDDTYEMRWNKLYTVTNFISRYQRNTNENNRNFLGIKDIGECENTTPFPFNRLDKNFNPFFLALCLIIEVIGTILGIIQSVIGGLLVSITRIVCLISHLTDADERGRCRCYFCEALNGDSTPGDGACPPIMTALECTCAEEYQDSGTTNCDDECRNCNVSLVQLFCNGVFYTDVEDWKDCILRQLVLELGIVRFEFYNDWIVGSLYSYSFAYKIRYRRARRKSLERFCDLDCRQTQVGITSDDIHYKNVCRKSYIVDKEFVNNDSPISTQINPPNGRGLITEYEGQLYYSARWDFGSNDPSVYPLVSSEEKKYLLYATNIAPLGTIRTCDIDGTPNILEYLQSTSYQIDEGLDTLFNFNCLRVQNVKSTALLVESQLGVDITLAQTSRIGSLVTDDDDETYTITANPTGSYPEKESTVDGILLLDREDALARQYLCENFPFYSLPRVYSTASYPQPPDLTLADDDGDIVSITTDQCTNFDTDSNLWKRMHPYYFYFGIRQGNTALDKLKRDFLRPCK